MEAIKNAPKIAVVFLFLALVILYVSSGSGGGTTNTHETQAGMHSGYVGYAFVNPNTPLEFDVQWAGKNTGPGFSIHVDGIPRGINWSTDVVDVPCPGYLKGMTCRNIALVIIPTIPGKYNLSQVGISVSTDAGTVSSKLGNVKLDVSGETFENLSPVYYPYAGAYLNRSISPEDEFVYYVLLKNSGGENLTVTGVYINSSDFTVLGPYYQKVPVKTPPQSLDVPNMSKARKFPEGGLSLKPGEIVAVIVPFRTTVLARRAVVVPRLDVLDGNGNVHSIPGIPYYIMGN